MNRSADPQGSSRRGHGRPAGMEIVPLGDLPLDVLDRVAARTRAILDTEVVIARTQRIPQASYQSSRGQYNASMILNAIRPVAWKKGWKRLAVLDADLFSEGLNFVFGQADLSGSTAVISLERLRNEYYALPPDEGLLVERAVKEAVHEIGHTLGLPHCRKPECVMYFSNSLSDTDRKGERFCEGCEKRRMSGGRR